jgi:hypothetical protein
METNGHSIDPFADLWWWFYLCVFVVIPSAFAVGWLISMMLRRRFSMKEIFLLITYLCVLFAIASPLFRR